jgi:tRNA-dihydrouridine synthase
MTVKIGNIELKTPVALAPMAGVSDLSYRLICEEMGVGLVTTEMVSAKAILYDNRNV